MGPVRPPSYEQSVRAPCRRSRRKIARAKSMIANPASSQSSTFIITSPTCATPSPSRLGSTPQKPTQKTCSQRAIKKELPPGDPGHSGNNSIQLAQPIQEAGPHDQQFSVTAEEGLHVFQPPPVEEQVVSVMKHQFPSAVAADGIADIAAANCSHPSRKKDEMEVRLPPRCQKGGDDQRVCPAWARQSLPACLH